MRKARSPRRRRQPVSPFEYYTVVGAAIIAAGTFLMNTRYSWDVWEAYLIVVNILALVYYTLDKVLAWGHRQRIPERTLLALALVGGSHGGLAGMVLFQHKIRQMNFQRAFWVIVLIQAAGFAIVFFGFL